VDGVLGECGKCCSADERRCGAGHEYMHVGAELDEIAGQIRRLVRRNASRYPQHDGFALERLVRHQIRINCHGRCSTRYS
jgi:hypothetical protein